MNSVNTTSDLSESDTDHESTSTGTPFLVKLYCSETRSFADMTDMGNRKEIFEGLAKGLYKMQPTEYCKDRKNVALQKYKNFIYTDSEIMHIELSEEAFKEIRPTFKPKH